LEKRPTNIRHTDREVKDLFLDFLSLMGWDVWIGDPALEALDFAGELLHLEALEQLLSSIEWVGR
jgi:hypothetical protein